MPGLAGRFLVASSSPGVTHGCGNRSNSQRDRKAAWEGQPGSLGAREPGQHMIHFPTSLPCLLCLLNRCWGGEQPVHTEVNDMGSPAWLLQEAKPIRSYLGRLWASKSCHNSEPWASQGCSGGLTSHSRGLNNGEMVCFAVPSACSLADLKLACSPAFCLRGQSVPAANQPGSMPHILPVPVGTPGLGASCLTPWGKAPWRWELLTTLRSGNKQESRGCSFAYKVNSIWREFKMQTNEHSHCRPSLCTASWYSSNTAS
jgi:hypothetical protein